MRELALPNQTAQSHYVPCDISAAITRINLPFASLKSCDLAGRFEYNKAPFFFGPKGPPRFFACEKDLGQGARIFT